jgi:hypothetical protein
VKVQSVLKHVVCRSFACKHLQQQDAKAVHIPISRHIASNTILCNSRNSLYKNLIAHFLMYDM